MSDKFYITTSIPYVNAPPHIGHALEFVQTDAIARYHRGRGEETFLLTGADENALKNVQAAEKKGVAVERHVTEMGEHFKRLARALNISVDGYRRGSDRELHWPGVTELWRRSLENGDIYKKQYRGLYCVGHEAFITEKELDANGLCPDHQTKPDLVEEENYFFRLSRYADDLERRIASDTYRIRPVTRKNEMLAFIRQGLEDFSVSRSSARARGWGVPVPDDPDQVIYVWFDALTIYMTGVGFGIDEKLYEKWWPADIHVIGKDIIRFHALYWPAMLLSAKLPLPKELFVHGFVTSGGEKMSKTVGNVVDPFEYMHEFGSDALRYYLLAEIPTFEDGDFTRERFVERYNSDLAKGLGNVAARILTLADGKGFSGLNLTPGGIPEATRFKEAWERYGQAFAERDLRRAVQEVWSLIQWTDKYIEEKKPWENKDEAVLYTLCVALANIAWLLKPFLPPTAEKIDEALGIAGKKKWDFAPQKIAPLFPRIEE
jgi:methionyl-tRNA synthetase